MNLKLRLSLASLSFVALPALAQSTMKVETEKCVNESQILNTKTGRKLSAAAGHVTFIGHVISWEDGVKNFSITADQTTVLGHVFPEVSLKESNREGAPGANPYLLESTARTFNVNAYYVTQMIEKKTVQSYQSHSPTETLIVDVTPAPALRQPSFDQIIVKSGDRSSVTTTALGAEPPAGGIRILTSHTVCNYAPEPISSIHFVGFFDKVGERMLKFDAINTATLAAEAALSSCLNSHGDCTAAQSAANYALAARESEWAGLFAKSDFVAGAPNVHHGGGGHAHGGGSGGGSGGGGGVDFGDSGGGIGGFGHVGHGGGHGGGGWHSGIGHEGRHGGHGGGEVGGGGHFGGGGGHFGEGGGGHGNSGGWHGGGGGHSGGHEGGSGGWHGGGGGGHSGGGFSGGGGGGHESGGGGGGGGGGHESGGGGGGGGHESGGGGGGGGGGHRR